MPCFGEKASAEASTVANRPGLLRRMLNTIFEWRQKQTDRDVARFLLRSGGRLTDESSAR